ncbi:MAG: hypothetical protein B1H09_04100 [Gemmatimonadaceae bacterium 4484_173]|jgi:hypothetical protein|nr:MAG: hypothetical protein B1H09_04100 [Gemmatimonadaceae bacterium 4484_173]RKZ03472.1 MAG: hypothetical protein DRQ21_05750 [Candidatus Fermentibacteria bacterium]
MRTVAAIFLVAAALYASPEEDMSRVIDAVYRADGETILNCLSYENQEALATVISMVRLVPEQVSEQLREQLDVQLSPGEVASLTGEEMISVIVDSPFFRSEIPPSRDMISCDSHTMHGDTAYVFITIVNEDSVYSYPMMLQDGSWKISRSFF